MANKLANEMAEQAVRGIARVARDELNGREDNGWRAGKPVEDPEKMKRWGFLTAKPSEYLVHMRKGRILDRTSGQGATCFKWPWDSVAIIPTTIQRIFFVADQVTSEKVGVQIKGLCVYRIARPELSVRMINFSFPERAQEKLAETLRDMFVGAARRLIANLKVDDVLTKRKESLGAFLMAEIAPVVGGAGRPGDSTDRGWGVVIDTIEIQDVNILSEQVFKNMQAPYRNALQLKAREAELGREKETQLAEAQGKREIEVAKATAEGQIRELKAQAEMAAAQAELEQQKKKLLMQSEAERARLEREGEIARLKAEKEKEAVARRAEVEAAARMVKAQQDSAAEKTEHAERLAKEKLELAEWQARLAKEAELVRLKAESDRQAAELAAQAEQEKLVREREIARLKLAQQVEEDRERLAAEREKAATQDALDAELAERHRALKQAEAVADAELKRLTLEVERMQGELRMMLAARGKELENSISPEKLQLELVTKALPEIAKSFQQKFGDIRIVAGANENPFGFLLHAFDGVMQVAGKANLAGIAGAAAGAVNGAVNGTAKPALNGSGAANGSKA